MLTLSRSSSPGAARGGSGAWPCGVVVRVDIAVTGWWALSGRARIYWRNPIDYVCHRTSCHSRMRRASWVCRPSASVSWSWPAICPRSGSETHGPSRWTRLSLAGTHRGRVGGLWAPSERGARSSVVKSIWVGLVATRAEETSCAAR